MRYILWNMAMLSMRWQSYMPQEQPWIIDIVPSINFFREEKNRFS